MRTNLTHMMLLVLVMLRILWAGDLKVLHRISLDRETVNSSALSVGPRGLVAITTKDGILVLDVPKSEVVFEVPGAYGAEFSSDGDFLMASDLEHIRVHAVPRFGDLLGVIDLGRGSGLLGLPKAAASAPVVAQAFVLKGPHDQAFVRLYSITGEVIAPEVALGAYFHNSHYALSPDARSLAVVRGATLELWDTLSGECVHQQKLEEPAGIHDWVKDQLILFEKDSLRIFEPDDRLSVLRKSPEVWPQKVAYSSEFGFAVSKDGMLYLLDPNTLEITSSFQQDGLWCTWAEFFPGTPWLGALCTEQLTREGYAELLVFSLEP